MSVNGYILFLNVNLNITDIVHAKKFTIHGTLMTLHHARDKVYINTHSA